MTSCFTSDCPDPPEGADAVLKCFPASGAECQAFNATLDGGFAEDETCCESRREILNCPSPPRVEPTYNEDGMKISDGYSLPNITQAQLKEFSDPNSTSFGKLVLRFPVAYMRLQHGLGQDGDEVFVRGIAAYLEGATLDTSATKFKVNLTAKGEMKSQVKKPPESHECAATSGLFDDYIFAGAPSGQQYCSSADCNPPNAVVYETSYWNWHESDGCGGIREQPVFSNTRFAYGSKFSDDMRYCTTESYEKSYQNAALTKTGKHGPYNSASLFSSFELSVTSDGTPVNNWGIDLSGVTAIHIGFWLMTTEADERQCSKMCDATFTGDECKGVNDIMKQVC